MKKNDIWSIIMSIVVIGCLPGLSAAVDSDPGGINALPSQPSGTGSVNYENTTGISGGGINHAPGTQTTPGPETAPGTEITPGAPGAPALLGLTARALLALRAAGGKRGWGGVPAESIIRGKLG